MSTLHARHNDSKRLRWPLTILGIGVGVALLTIALVLGRQVAKHSCGGGPGVCLGHTTYHPHALVAILIGAVGVTLVLWTPIAARRIGRGEQVVIGGWRHPIDAIGVRFLGLPTWRRVAIIILAFPIVAWVTIIYLVRRALLGPPADARRDDHAAT